MIIYYLHFNLKVFNFNFVLIIYYYEWFCFLLIDLKRFFHKYFNIFLSNKFLPCKKNKIIVIPQYSNHKFMTLKQILLSSFPHHKTHQSMSPKQMFLLIDKNIKPLFVSFLQSNLHIFPSNYFKFIFLNSIFYPNKAFTQ